MYHLIFSAVRNTILSKRTAYDSSSRARWTAFNSILAGVLFVVHVCIGSPALLSQESRNIASAQKVGVIETEELKQLVFARLDEIAKFEAVGKTPPPQSFVLVDVRSDREMSVSTIPCAISKSEFEKNINKFSGKVVIPYCTVGGRCGDFSKQLAQAGWTVKSYRGSIVEWVQNELPLVTPKGKPTDQVHTNGGDFKLPAKYKAVVK